MGTNLALALLGLATAVVAAHGLATGSVYCKGGPYSRATQPVAFWASIAVYVLWTVMMGYFVLSSTGK
jgi:hypothetical protein